MGESTCLMQPFCYASGISNEANESNPIHAFGQSISFGRFTSESLAWEKWSTFSHNRYVEEAERYSRPGSVAQKKAFFEAHYKKIAAQKAAALLEQANNASSNNLPQQEPEVVAEVIISSTHNSETASPNPKLIVNEEHEAKVEEDFIGNADGYSSNTERNNFESNRVNGAEPKTKQQPFMGNSMRVELQNQLADVNNHKETAEKVSGTLQMEKLVLKQKNSKSDQEVTKPSVSSSAFLKKSETSKFPASPANSRALTYSEKYINATPTSKKPAMNSADKKRSTPKSVHKSLYFTPLRELNRLTATVMRKIDSSRVGPSTSKASKDCLTPLRTPNVVSKYDLQKHSSVTPLTEKRRTGTPVDCSASGRKTAGPKWRLLSSEKKPLSPIISTPFNLRTEERAARRKKRLEENFNANEAQKVQLHIKFKEKAETEIRKLRQGFCFKARPLPDFYKERQASKNEVALAHPESPKQGRKHISTLVEDKTSLPHQRPSINKSSSKCFQGKNSRTAINSATSMPVMVTHENTSPNIRHGNQNYKYHK
ncbi:Protein WVD2-like 7 [Quillaja saponaria]|uniref:Protein WVD2-like 7 n=1 Tax=Quillaja saponaria TaxID=32244 RepID=A0AAD7VGG9_QUISA|nr:Protein WVD2-like 7 [Quillaja saponaria]